MIDMLDVLLAHLFPDDGKARAADIRGESAWEILENLHKRLQALDSHPDNYRSIMRQLGKIVGTAWAVGGTFDGESTAHRNLGLRINTSEPRQEVIIHDFDGAFIPSLQSQTDDLVKFTGTVSNGNVDGLAKDFFQLNYVEQFFRNLYRVPPTTPLGNDFWEGVQEAAEQAAQKIWRNPEQKVVSKEYLDAFRRWIDETTYIKGPDPIELDIFLKLMRAALNKAGNNVKGSVDPSMGAQQSDVSEVAATTTNPTLKSTEQNAVTPSHLAALVWEAWGGKQMSGPVYYLSLIPELLALLLSVYATGPPSGLISWQPLLNAAQVLHTTPTFLIVSSIFLIAHIVVRIVLYFQGKIKARVLLFDFVFDAVLLVLYGTLPWLGIAVVMGMHVGKDWLARRWAASVADDLYNQSRERSLKKLNDIITHHATGRLSKDMMERWLSGLKFQRVLYPEKL